MRLLPLLTAINTHLAAALGPGAAIHAADHQRYTPQTPLPAALTEITDITLIDPLGDDGTERLCITLALSTFVAYTTSGDERENRIAVRALALRLAHTLRYHFKHPTVSNPRVTDITHDYLDASADNSQGANNASLIECQRIDWLLDTRVGPDIWENWTLNPIAQKIHLAPGLHVPFIPHFPSVP